MITMQNWRVTVPDDKKQIGYEGDHLAYKLVIQTDLDHDWSIKLDIQCGNMKNIIDLTRDGDLLCVDLTRDMLKVDGMHQFQLRGFRGDVVAHSDVWRMFVGRSINAVDILPDEPPSEFYQMEQRMTALKAYAEIAADRAVNASLNPPKLSETATWLVWDKDADTYKDTGVYSGGDAPYIGDNGHWFVGADDTGVSARGEKGAKGDRGDAGAQGIQGDQGERGLRGERGEQGERGLQGAQGEPGPKGDKGDAGIQGEQGIQGIPGEKGEKGDTGAKGEQGSLGEWTTLAEITISAEAESVVLIDRPVTCTEFVLVSRIQNPKDNPNTENKMLVYATDWKTVANITAGILPDQECSNFTKLWVKPFAFSLSARGVQDGYGLAAPTPVVHQDVNQINNLMVYGLGSYFGAGSYFKVEGR